MTEAKSFQPNWTSAPGETIADSLANLGLTEDQFAQKIGKEKEYVNDLLRGRERITLEVAKQLEEVLGASVEFWMSRDYEHRQALKRIEAKHGDWLESIPLDDMIDFGWIKGADRSSDKVAACLNFFDVPSVEAWHEVYGNLPAVASYKTSPSYESSKESVATWLRHGERKAAEIDCNPWDREGFKESLTEIRTLTKEKDPSQFIPALREKCTENGVAVAVLRSPTGCHASGATYFTSDKKALLLLSFRHLSNDHFWFTFFHEAGHLVLHSDKDLFIDDDDTLSGEYELGMNREEKEANKFAKDTLIPPHRRSELKSLKISHRNVVRFAVKIGIAPGIVVGQLQHHGKIGFDTLNKLKRQYSWDEIPT
jgi:plasmid maintenance system antidote protein VapI